MENSVLLIRQHGKMFPRPVVQHFFSSYGRKSVISSNKVHTGNNSRKFCALTMEEFLSKSLESVCLIEL